MDSYDLFIDGHRPQLELSGVPKIFWQTVFEKLKQQIFDAGMFFQIVKIDYSESMKRIQDPEYKLFVSAEAGLSSQDANNIFLIDHAWTYDVRCAKKHLCETPGLLDRMCNLMCYDIDDDGDDDDRDSINNKIEFVLREMWRYNQSFALSTGTVEQKIPIWYIMDEVGTAINQNDKPNFRTVPFLYLNEGATYTLLFPVDNVECNDEVTRDFVENQTSDPAIKRALLLPWIETNFINVNFVQVEPDKKYFLSGRIEENLPDRIDSIQLLKRDTATMKKLKVFTDYSVIIDYLTDPSFEIVDREEEADIIWSMNHIRDYKSLSEKLPHVFVNQFPYEHVLTVKDLLCIVARRAANNDELYDCETLDTYPSWLPTTYNLSTELVEFVSYFKNREAKNLDNHWICKPWNLARGLDIHVTKNLFHIVRLPSTGPKIAQKYISSPVLYTRPGIGKVKFDIRYVILLKSIDPLRVYTYSNFFLRFANKEFALNNLNDYEQHFTVMNYSEETSLHHVKCADFITQWNNMYPNHLWRTYVEPKIFNMIQELFEAATSARPPKGIAANPQSRALYAIDMMLEWKVDEMQPVLLEVNFSPDNKRACQYYPEFYNDIFKLLFVDIENPSIFHETSAKI